MMCNVPLSYTCDSLIGLLESKGFSGGSAHFVYVPMNFTEMLGVGYAFLNMTTPERAEEFMLAFEGFDGWASSFSKTACSMRWSNCQGLSENVSRYRNSPMMSEEVPAFYKPVLLRDGVRVPFPKPTKQLRTLSPFSMLSAISPADTLPLKVFLSDDDGSTTGSDTGVGSDPCHSDSDETAWSARPVGAPPGLGLDACTVAPARRTPLRSQAAAYSPLRSQAEAFVPLCLALAASAPGAGAHAEEGAKEARKTTVMMCNVPLSYTCDSLIGLLESKGGSAHFVYVPMNFTEMLGVGYAFLNMTTPERAEEFMLAFEGFDGWASSFSKTACSMRWSNCQGLSENVSRYRNSPMMSEEVPAFYKPVLLRDGVRVPFPKPTKQLRTLRRRKGKEQEGEDTLPLKVFLSDDDGSTTGSDTGVGSDPCHSDSDETALAGQGTPRGSGTLSTSQKLHRDARVGYAFLNMTTPERAEEFMLAFEGFDGWASSFSKTACSMRWSNCQGLSENVSRYRNSPMMSEEVPAFYKPVLLRDGVRVPFPKPTKQLRTLRRRKGKEQEGEDTLPLKVFLSDDDGSTTGSDTGVGSDPCHSDSDETAWSAGPVGAPPGLGPDACTVAPARRTPLRSQAAAYSPLRSQAEAFVPLCLALAASAPGAGAHAKEGAKEARKTTVMMCNVPLSYTCDSLIGLLESKGGSAHFVYVPMNFTEMLGVGYAFLNMTTPERAEEFMLAFEGFDGWASSFSKTACSMRWSNCQGLSENVSRYRNSPMMSEEVPAFYKPVLLRDGVRVPFPKPTKQLRTLRRRKGKEQEGEDTLPLKVFLSDDDGSTTGSDTDVGSDPCHSDSDETAWSAGPVGAPPGLGPDACTAPSAHHPRQGGREEARKTTVMMCNMLGVGYAFLNMTTPERAEEFMLAFEGFDGWASSFSKTACSMRWSNCQGLSENVSRYRNSPMMSEEVPAFYKPVFLRDGVRVPFPKPTKQLRTLRRRKGKEQEGED
ncbi:unnamed protein product [Prorocentrum cordatum]|uniref:Mei2-like C-terminal RNA recognition motif domain-containing protein n=1 Tax=Prorocentrum cordatum TaxID=2364126 RepID=A0ABN9ST63_9DINO|nr:unnamed protein product [Polarella glacialis]